MAARTRDEAGVGHSHFSAIVLGIQGLKLKGLRSPLACFVKRSLRNYTVKNEAVVRKTPTQSHNICICPYFCMLQGTTFPTRCLSVPCRGRSSDVFLLPPCATNPACGPQAEPAGRQGEAAGDCVPGHFLQP